MVKYVQALAWHMKGAFTVPHAQDELARSLALHHNEDVACQVNDDDTIHSIKNYNQKTNDLTIHYTGFPFLGSQRC